VFQGFIACGRVARRLRRCNARYERRGERKHDGRRLPHVAESSTALASG